jgi:hypothetical protein
MAAEGDTIKEVQHRAAPIGFAIIRPADGEKFI